MVAGKRVGIAPCLRAHHPFRKWNSRPPEKNRSNNKDSAILKAINTKKSRQTNLPSRMSPSLKIHKIKRHNNQIVLLSCHSTIQNGADYNSQQNAERRRSSRTQCRRRENRLLLDNRHSLASLHIRQPPVQMYGTRIYDFRHTRDRHKRLAAIAPYHWSYDCRILHSQSQSFRPFPQHPLMHNILCMAQNPSNDIAVRFWKVMGSVRENMVWFL